MRREEIALIVLLIFSLGLFVLAATVPAFMPHVGAATLSTQDVCGLSVNPAACQACVAFCGSAEDYCGVTPNGESCCCATRNGLHWSP